VENLNEEMGFGEESWKEISGDTLGDVREQRMTTLGSWMAWRLLARRLLAWQSFAAQGAVFSSMGAVGLMMGAIVGLMGAVAGSMMRAVVSLLGAVGSLGALCLMGKANRWRRPGGLMESSQERIIGLMGAVIGSMGTTDGSLGALGSMGDRCELLA
jgi:hypothetical protein